MIEVVCFPRLSEADELVLRLCEPSWKMAIEIVESSSDRLASGTIYGRLARLVREGFLRKDGRFYVVTDQGRRALRALDVAAKAYEEGR